MNNIQVSPSILSADFANLGDEIRKVQNADMLHIDVMDGHFVPNLSVGVPVVASIRKTTAMPLDVHLMMTHPLDFVTPFANAGADYICFHCEAESDAVATIKKIHSHGKKAGLAFKPATPIEAVVPYINDIDLLLVMTVEPGFGGQAFMADMMPKLRQAKKLIKQFNRNIVLQVDGGINCETAAQCIKNGANLLVAGAFVFSSDSPAEAVEQLQSL